MTAKASGQALEVGYLSPAPVPGSVLASGEIGYIVTNLRSIDTARVGDTVTLLSEPVIKALPGYQEVKSYVYAGLFPVSNDDYQALKDALEKLTLNDSALQYLPENSQVLGFGFRVGFLGLLHMDIVRERLEREYGLELIITSPSTDYRVKIIKGDTIIIKNAADLPDQEKIVSIEEPWIVGDIVCPKRYVGAVIQQIIIKRGQQKNVDYIDGELAIISFEAPLANVLIDFFDKLKSSTSGYGSLNYEFAGYRVGDLVRLDFLVAGERVDALSVVAHRQEVNKLGRDTVAKLRQAIPRQLFKVSLQAAIGGKIIAREDIPPLKKNVAAHLYGGDVSRKKKLWAKQARGKARMKRFGKVDIPTDTFVALLRRD